MQQGKGRDREGVENKNSDGEGGEYKWVSGREETKEAGVGIEGEGKGMKG